MLQFVEFEESFKEKHGFKNDEEVGLNLLSHATKFLNEKFGKSLLEGIEDNINEFDLNKIYKVNWACIFNETRLVGSECKILAKNSKIASVIFGDNRIGVYRLEDLTCIN